MLNWVWKILVSFKNHHFWYFSFFYSWDKDPAIKGLLFLFLQQGADKIYDYIIFLNTNKPSYNNINKIIFVCISYLINLHYYKSTFLI